MISDPIGDMLTRIRNGYMAGNKNVTMPYSKSREAVVKVLIENKILADYQKDTKTLKKTLIVKLVEGRRRPFEIKRVSKPGRRIYLSNKNFYKVKGDQGVLIISTSKGVMDNKKANKLKIGGEIIAEIF
ncbi:30S ribosomal protein S8 [Candidatus Roizmanbacteria bacterium RIFOXYB2_FULL_41_10]|uniref:Small ribosomal subunit protein uS8 n=1 Tax=Candidatus Roizmanbacteria bacterium RIFOXYA1_FULL_41_12 TaxID=1802082 RepID=A0A1F7K988_9BACT|nr:MAG: 30S ribosomal protein S8 [Candidatus Roizmanbacteria bacterium RIFOXYA1_FULL_41_12]OGK67864.1 MAG: 30S ribosomal protein S8 [Candidatus Roizmanbacteria bacterium RIFOXYB1_FULL_41_27]OGK68226.1 MAG: 30S ribosomal protein S8 [Candidatus Roizmanbacteria bacterium RIFOXYA2_FULL_41_8]OGK69213.1 MAG: 30S ribosomal protein S8 [Candidatus Roizmanbacteria bacterium RIFOXYB2_FULL_41_10]OGK72044.1 MAG: 30S ribosomal protein S8 [Candidatus Roizmanbacteria bacterium RIFOXYC1_FULL_41_16]OGK73012.1 M